MWIKRLRANRRSYRAVNALPDHQNPAPLPAKKEEIGAKKTEKKADAKQTISANPPSSINVTVSGELQLKSPDQQQRGHDYFFQNPEWWVVGATIALVWVTARLVYFTRNLWQSTQTTSERQAEEMEKSLAITKQAAEAARDSAEAARQEFVASHRPMIRVKHLHITSEIWGDKPIDVKLIITNIGITPAIIRFMSVDTAILGAEKTLPGRPVFSNPNRAVSQDISRVESGGSLILPRITVRQLSMNEHPRIMDGSLKFYCFGVVDYLDADGRTRQTGFCRVWEPPRGPNALSEPGKFVLHPDPDYEYQD